VQMTNLRIKIGFKYFKWLYIHVVIYFKYYFFTLLNNDVRDNSVQRGPKGSGSLKLLN
jgi:hypothetical protein